MVFGGNGAMAMDIDSCCCVAKDLDMALSSSIDWDFTMASGGQADYLQQAILLHPCVSSSASLHRA